MEYDLKTFTFGRGSHRTREDGLCVMEAVAYLAGEPHSDRPQCACPVITELAIWLNDSCNDSLRQELLQDLPWRIVGTKASEEIEQQRGYMAADWAVRFVRPILFRRAGMEKQSLDLECLPTVSNKQAAADAAAWAARAARAADAAAEAAWAARAARAAAMAAEAARAARAAAMAAGAAARAARAAGAAGDLEAIQRSLANLLGEMISLTEPKESQVITTEKATA